MTKSVTKDIAAIGPVRFEKSRRAKRMNISIRPFKGVRVAVPSLFSMTDAELFVLEKADWIRQKLHDLQEVEAQLEKAVHQAVTIDQAAAERILSTRLAELAHIHGFSYNRVKFRNQKTRWGSCSGINNISLNRQLILLPDSLIEYVLLHELLHTRVKNHSATFWTELETILPGACQRAAELKRYRIAPL